MRRRRVGGRLDGNKATIVSSNTPVEDEAGRGMHSVGGSARPGKVSKRTLTKGCIAESAGQGSTKKTGTRVWLFPYGVEAK